jgi:hypothetical protein
MDGPRVRLPTAMNGRSAKPARADAAGLPRRYRGPEWFGTAYATMIRHDPHARNSVDRQIIESSVGLDRRSAHYLYREFTPVKVRYKRGTRPVLEAISTALAGRPTRVDARVRAVAQFLSDLAATTSPDVGKLRFGGTEEEIIARGTDWCTDLSRVGCALYQTLGLPSRMVLLADTSSAYSGHAITEVRYGGRWGAVDCVTGAIYQRPSGEPASTWDLVRNPRWVDRQYRNGETQGCSRDQFRAAAISNYTLASLATYDYSVRGVNPYYRSILRMSERGWPGGLRWLHGEGPRASPRA